MEDTDFGTVTSEMLADMVTGLMTDTQIPDQTIYEYPEEGKGVQDGDR